ncbi:MAG: 1-deoxy-D-xylulose-5-phosphate reductoisomerase [Treponema sp.]|nr:1-deoxy-D-xylulose-5-phosphate reductoisomerase [Treponema sp.]
MKKRIAVLGATGSIGASTLDVIRSRREDFEVALLSACFKGKELEVLGQEFPGAWLVLTRDSRELSRVIRESRPEITVNGIAGAAGLEPSLAALEAGSDLVLANKETMVMAGPLVLALAASTGRRILPVDSEHAAIWSLLEAHGREALEEILLTASGGPFRKFPVEALAGISPMEALKHPTWNMGPKITVDSATMANKGLEVIEAARLFEVSPEQIQVLVHPQSIVHSMVRLKNGAIYADMSKPDMRLPIHNALAYPDCLPCPFGRLDLAGLNLEFEKSDPARFPMLPLAYEAARLGGLYPAAYNAANETAVGAFLEGPGDGAPGFLDIPRIVEYVLGSDWDCSGKLEDPAALEAILEADRQARDLAEHYIREKN